MEREYLNDGEPQMRPAHPGEILDADVLPALGLNVTAAAAALGISRQTLHRILAGHMGVSPEMALRLGQLCGNGAAFWLRLQALHDIWHAERRIGSEIARIPAPPIVHMMIARERRRAPRVALKKKK
jgi:antitoxin HigA-1